jgi:hypothetical protein
MIRVRRHAPLILALGLIVAAAPWATAGELIPRPAASDGVAAVPDVAAPPQPILCPHMQLDQGGRMVEHCSPPGTTADYAVRVHDSPFDTGGTDWLAEREALESISIQDVLGAAGSSVAIIGMHLEALLRAFAANEEEITDEFGSLTTVSARGGGRIYAVFAVLGFLVLFGGLAGWLLWRRHRRKERRINAARRTAAALLGELVSIRDALRELALDNRPGRLDALDRVASMRQAFVQNQGYLSLIERGVATQIVGFYGELRNLPTPYVEERVGKLGTHRVLRLEAADGFERQSQALASRAGQLADQLRAWLDRHLPRGAVRPAAQERR